MRLFLLSLFVAAFSFANVAKASGSNAVGDCFSALDNLAAVTSSASSLTSKEQSGLVKIAMDARQLYTIGKTNDAVKKLYDFQVKLDQLAATLNNPKPKISASDEQAIREALNDALACVQGS